MATFCNREEVGCEEGVSAFFGEVTGLRWCKGERGLSLVLPVSAGDARTFLDPYVGVSHFVCLADSVKDFVEQYKAKSR